MNTMMLRKILLIAVGVLVLSGCGKTAGVRENVVVMANINVNQLDVNNISNWQTYKNEDYGFSFKYPETYSVYPPRQYAASLAEHNIVINISYKYDLPKYEYQYSGMANQVTSQESFDSYNEKLANSNQTGRTIDGSENSNLVEEYNIFYGDYYITVYADAGTILKKLGKDTEHFSKDNILSENTPAEVTDYFNTLDKIVTTLDLSGLQVHEGNANFIDAVNSVENNIVFDGCGDSKVYANQTWFSNLSDNLQKYVLTPDDVTDICYSEPGQMVVLLAGADYCRSGHLFRYDIQNNKFEEAERLNSFYDCTTAPTGFGERTGQIIEMTGQTGDGGCWATDTFEYNYVTNKYRESHSVSMCDGDKSSTTLDY